MTSNVAGNGPPKPRTTPYAMYPPPVINRDKSTERHKSNAHGAHAFPFKHPGEPPSKRQKTDVEIETMPRSDYVGLAEGSLSIQGPPAPTSPTSSSKQPHSSPIRRPSLFPIRPNSAAAGNNSLQSPILAIERAAMKDSVPIRPYVAEPPTCAPRHYRNGTSCIPHSGELH